MVKLSKVHAVAIDPARAQGWEAAEMRGFIESGLVVRTWGVTGGRTNLFLEIPTTTGNPERDRNRDSNAAVRGEKYFTFLSSLIL